MKTNRISMLREIMKHDPLSKFDVDWPDVDPIIKGVETDFISLGDINIGPYQRPPQVPHAQKIAAKFSRWAIQINMITLAKRPDGTYWLLDGLQRVTAGQIAGYTDPWPSMVIWTDGSLATEAALFDILNVKRKNLRAFDLYVCDLTRKVSDAMVVQSTADMLGMNIDKFACIGAMRTWARTDPELFQEAMIMAHGLDGGKVSRDLLSGLCMLETRLREKKQPSLFEGKYRTILTEAGGKVIAQAMLDYAAIEGQGWRTSQVGGLLAVLNRRLRTKIVVAPYNRKEDMVTSDR